MSNITLTNVTITASQLLYTVAPISFNGADIIAMLCLIAIFFVGIPGNLLVIFVFGIKRKKVRTRFETFLLLLAFVDLVSLMFTPSSFFYLTVTKFRMWHFGRIGCKFIPSVLQVSITISQGVLILISYERYQAIVSPFDSRISDKTVAAWMTTIIVLALVFVSPYTVTFHVLHDPAYRTDTCVPAADKYDLLVISSFMQVARDLIALFIMVVCGIQMHRALTRKISVATWNRACMSTKGRRILKVVIAVFTILILPCDLFQVLFYNMVYHKYDVSPEVFRRIVYTNTFLNILQMANSVANVFIYSQMHSTFKLGRCFQKHSNFRFERQGTTISNRSTEFDHLFSNERIIMDNVLKELNSYGIYNGNKRKSGIDHFLMRERKVSAVTTVVNNVDRYRSYSRPKSGIDHFLIKTRKISSLSVDLNRCRTESIRKTGLEHVLMRETLLSTLSTDVLIEKGRRDVNAKKTTFLNQHSTILWDDSERNEFDQKNLAELVEL